LPVDVSKSRDKHCDGDENSTGNAEPGEMKGEEVVCASDGFHENPSVVECSIDIIEAVLKIIRKRIFG
jgi:hypothetical protein